MGVGPVFAVPKLLKRVGLTINDIGLWERRRCSRFFDPLDILATMLDRPIQFASERGSEKQSNQSSAT